MRNTILLITGFVVCLVVFLFALMPASVALSLGQEYLPKQLMLGAVRGTLWQGRINGVQYGHRAVSGMEWEIKPAALLTGRLLAKVNVGEPRNTDELSASGLVSFNLFSKDLVLENTKVRTRIEEVLREVNLPIPVETSGRLFVELDDFQAGQPYCTRLKGEISSPDIQVTGLTGRFSIGELAASLQCKSGALVLKTEPENLLGLEIDATLAANNRFNVDGYIKPDLSLPKEVHDAVKFIGRPDNQGRYPIKF